MSTRRAFEAGKLRERSARRGRRLKALVATAVVVISVLAFVAIAADSLFRPGAFPIQELRLEGEFVHVDPADLREVIVSEVGANYFSLDLGQIERVVEKLPWVRKATVQRSWPHGLKVTVVEQDLVARWGENEWLNADAEVMRLEAFADPPGLIRLAGPEGSAPEVWRYYNAWLPEMRDLGLEIVAVELDQRYAWIIRARAENAEQGFSILLGSSDHERRWRRFVRSYKTFLQAQAPRLTSVDLRYPNGIAVRKRGEPGNDRPSTDTGLNG